MNNLIPIDLIALLLLGFFAITALYRFLDQLWLHAFLEVNPLDWARATSNEERVEVLRARFRQAALLYQYKVLAFLRQHLESKRAELGNSRTDGLLQVVRGRNARVVGFSRASTVPFPYTPKRLKETHTLTVTVYTGEFTADILLPTEGLPRELRIGFLEITRASSLLSKADT